MKLNDDSEIIDPNVGDAELRRIDFDAFGATLHICLALQKGSLILRATNVVWLSLSTDCSQNVIDTILILDDWTTVASLAPRDIQEVLASRRQSIPGESAPAYTVQAIVVKPVSGASLICIAESCTGDDQQA